MRDAHRENEEDTPTPTSPAAAGQDRRQLHSGDRVLVKWIRRIIKPKVISHRTCLQRIRGNGKCPAKKPKSSQPIIIPIVVQWQFSVCSVCGRMLSLLGTFGYNVPRTMVSRRAAAAAAEFLLPKLWHFKCRKPTKQQQKQQQHRQWQHYLVNVDDMTRPLRATNKQTITGNRAQDELGRN